MARLSATRQRIVMKSRLDSVRDWERRARISGYSASKMARRLGVSLRFLETFFAERFGVPPHYWMVRVRMTRAAGLLNKGTPAKIVSIKIGYKQLSHFSREFKRYFGKPPRDYVDIKPSKTRILHGASYSDNKLRN